jgi:site-specific DNA recombinase
MKAVGYYRFSSDNQHEESIEQQRETVRAYAEKNNIQIIKEYVDRAESATSDNRPDFKNMASDIMEDRIRIDYVLVYNTNRFARNRRDAIVYKYDFAEKGVEVISVTQYIGNVPGKAIFEAINEALDEEYSKNLSREVKAKMRTHATKAKHLGGTPPLGYNVVLIDGVKKYSINEQEAKSVRLIYDMKLKGYGYGDIIKALNSKGYLTKRGKPFGKNSLHEILVNEKYSGTYVYCRATRHNYHKNNPNNEIIKIPEAMPVIIERSTWLEVQKIMNNNRIVFPKKKNTAEYLLTGKIFCGNCNGAYVGSSRFNGKKIIRYYSYECNNHKRTGKCSNPSIAKEPLERYVVEDIRDTFFNCDFNELAEKFMIMYRDKYPAIESDIDNLKQEIDNINQKISRLYEAVENGLGNQETYNRINGFIQQKQTMEEALIIATTKAKIVWTKEKIVKYMKEKKKALSSSDTATCKELINLFVKRVILTPDDIIIEYHFGVDNDGGPEGIRTLDLCDANAALSQLSHEPTLNKMLN